MINKFLLICVIFFCLNSFAQRSNIANINTVALWAKMPEKAKADSILQDYQTEYSNYYTELIKKYEADAKSYQTQANSNELIKKQKEDDLIRQQKSISEYKATAEQLIIAKKDELYAPIKTKMQSSIDEVALKLKYDYVLDTSFGNIIFVKNEKDNILPEVLKHLGIN